MVQSDMIVKLMVEWDRFLKRVRFEGKVMQGLFQIRNFKTKQLWL